jgi:glycosyltransferase involved in cell wall biosynthesis
MKICFLTRLDPFDHKSWSGICYQMFSSLASNHEVQWIGNKDVSIWVRFLIKFQTLYEQLIRRKRGYSHFNKAHCILKSRSIKKKIRESKFDLIFAPNSPDYVAYLETETPILYLRDTTFQLLVDYYPSFFGLGEKEINEANEIEKNAIDKAWKIIYSSKWSSESAINFYGANKNKISIIDFGANLLFKPQKTISTTPLHNELCNILFIGVDWVRKGGDIAYKTFLKLRNEGFKCRLIIVGCKPRLKPESADIQIIPFLDKKNNEDFHKLFKIYLQAHFLLLPTRADCTPVVFSEAAAFGIPVITTDTGGNSSVIIEGVNGYLFPVNSQECCFANKIKSVFEDKSLYYMLRRNSRNEFESRLSWQVWIDKVNQLIS